MKDEKIKILEMIEKGTITSTEGLELIESIESEEKLSNFNKIKTKNVKKIILLLVLSIVLSIIIYNERLASMIDPLGFIEVLIISFIVLIINKKFFYKNRTVLSVLSTIFFFVGIFITILWCARALLFTNLADNIRIIFIPMLYGAFLSALISIIQIYQNKKNSCL